MLSLHNFALFSVTISQNMAGQLYCVSHIAARAGWSKHATRIKAARAVRLLESKPIGATAVELGRARYSASCDDCVKSRDQV